MDEKVLTSAGLEQVWNLVKARDEEVKGSVADRALSNLSDTSAALVNLGAQPAETAINTSNIGQQSVNYANSAGSASSAGTLSATLPVNKGGTGLTAAPSLLVNLASTAAASILAANPRPGVTGTLPVTRGGTGVTTIAALKTALGISSGVNITTGSYQGDDVDGKAMSLSFSFTPKILIMQRQSVNANYISQIGSYNTFIFIDKCEAYYTTVYTSPGDGLKFTFANNKVSWEPNDFSSGANFILNSASYIYYYVAIG